MNTNTTPATATRPPHQQGSRGSARRLVLRTSLLAALAAFMIVSAGTSVAQAGTYTMSQCGAGTTAVSPGWSVFSATTIANTVLWNTCSTGGTIGDYAYSENQAGAVTQSGGNGSQVGVQLIAPGSAPNVTIKSLAAEVIGSSVTGNDAFMGFSSGGQALPGEVELPYGGSDYTANDSWTLPQGARDFAAHVYCSTDHSSPTCHFADSINIPGLRNVTLTLNDNVAPSVTSVSGTLDAAAASHSKATGSQTISFTAGDADSGVKSATLTLTPQSAGAAYTHTFDFSAQCSYESWNACPSPQAVNGFTLNTSSLTDDTYTAALSVTDAAGNTSSDQLGNFTTSNAPTNTTAPTIVVPGQIVVGSALSTQPGAWSTPTGAGSVTYAYQWQQCNSQGSNCFAIAGAQNASYTPAPSDVGHTLRVLVTAIDNDGSNFAASSPTSEVLAASGSLGALPGPGTTSNNATPGPTITATPAPNGAPASITAQLHLGVQQRITRPYAHGAVKLTGRLLDGQGHPIGAATLDVLQQTAGSSSTQLVIQPRTRPDGTFAVTVPAGPSRVINVGYRAIPSDASYTAQAKITETVSAGVQLKITPQHTTPNGKIKLLVTVRGPIPRHGAIVDLLVHYLGHWEPFRNPRTDSHGHLHVEYQFEGGQGRYPFRAEVPGGQTGFPFTRGLSNIINVSTR